MRFLISILLTPLLVFLELIVMAIAVKQFSKKRLSALFYVLAFVWLYLITTPILSKYPIKNLEKSWQPINTIPDSFNTNRTHILVLGAGHLSDTALPYKEQLNYVALGRLVEGIRIQKQIPESKLVLSGWGAKQRLSQAEVMKFAARELGVPDSVMVIIPEPWNTKTEAQEYKKRFNNGYNLFLITDAIHMKRSLYHFRNQGLNPIPAPANFIIKESDGSFIKQLIPSGATLSHVERTCHEYIGLLWAYLGGN
jgi:uncharacterized SAM-binding protein YcdF (DUF218 family)